MSASCCGPETRDPNPAYRQVLWSVLTINAAMFAVEISAGLAFGALLANALSFVLLWAFRGGDANMQSAWICTRNDVIGNLAVLAAAAALRASQASTHPSLIRQQRS